MGSNNLQFTSNFEYRNYLTKNGAKIINMDNSNAISHQLYNCNYQHVESKPLPITHPFLYSSMREKEKPSGYTESNLKTDFINRRVNQLTQDNFRVHNAIEHVFNILYTNFIKK